ncbi:CopG family transcriptional regulator [Vibrio algivorus]|uniref:CopG family transcriptional regulator n=1 Tax=Vibrio algivorus TaxID=1667024 RepID=A0A557NSZ0_9VIBR|nr:CopG family transcriptional regulator [Vibrio algivorus]TVO31542.1 CopG family transcriptional regulator [Vibrio algivorus]
MAYVNDNPVGNVKFLINSSNKMDLLCIGVFFGVINNFVDFDFINDEVGTRLKLQGEIDRLPNLSMDSFFKIRTEIQSKKFVLPENLIHWIQDDYRAQFYVFSQLKGLVDNNKINDFISETVDSELRERVKFNVSAYMDDANKRRDGDLYEVIWNVLSFNYLIAKMSEMFPHRECSNLHPFHVRVNVASLVTTLDGWKANYIKNKQVSSLDKWFDFSDQQQCEWFVRYIYSNAEKYNIANISARARPPVVLGDWARYTIDTIYRIDSGDIYQAQFLWQKVKSAWSSQKHRLESKKKGRKQFSYYMSSDVEDVLTEMKRKTGMERGDFVEAAIRHYSQIVKQDLRKLAGK